MILDETHDPSASSWIETARGHAAFPVQNLPYGVFTPPASDVQRPGVAIGDQVLDLGAAAGLLPQAARSMVTATNLNGLFSLSSPDRAALRKQIFALLSLERHRQDVQPLLFDTADCTLHMPVAIGDYADFYTGINHARNVGNLFRPDAPLLPNYKWLPIGYHGRASSVRLAGTPVVRPNGQIRTNGGEPRLAPSAQLDFELEMAIWLGPGSQLGRPVPVGEAASHIVGFGLLNDWSARDIQFWEYQPLGPFLGKSFHSTVTPWVITSEALAPFRVAAMLRTPGDPEPLAYLSDEDDQRLGALKIDLEVHLSTAIMRERGVGPYRLSHNSLSDNMYWTVAQIVAHQTSNGCGLNPGDLIGSGTISGVDDHELGSMLEITLGGRRPVQLPSGETRTFLEDGDEVRLSGTARTAGFVPIGLGDCVARVVSGPPL